MPFKNLSALRKVTSLDAEVRGSAFLANPGLVVMLTSDPVRMLVHPVSGSNSKVSNVSLDRAEDVALLSREVAVVRSSDDAIWALTDIQHTPRPDQVARDMKLLCMRASGEIALALGWDGTGTALTVAKNEVEARQFQMRGTVRAAALTDNECFVVVDGTDGGQLRVHPGATPEPGAALRSNLPSEASSFDRLAAGPRLAVVYKPGQQNVCVVTGGPNMLRSKMLRIDAKPLAIAVFETSFVAVYADGRAALYDGDTIAGAGEGQTEPKHTLALGARGEPRAALGVSKGSSTLWVGTSGGEVYSAALVRKQG
jgi:hypothetical protein